MRVGIRVTLRRLKSYSKQGWKVLVDVFGVNHWLPLEEINPVWLNSKWYWIISVQNRTVYVIPLRDNDADD